MQSETTPSVFELLGCGGGLTVSLIGFGIRWEEITWCYGTPLFFVPLFLATLAIGIRLVGLNPTGTWCGVHPRIWWTAMTCLTIVVIEPKSAPLFVLPAVVTSIVWWFRQQFIRAEEIVASKKQQ